MPTYSTTPVEQCDIGTGKMCTEHAEERRKCEPCYRAWQAYENGAEGIPLCANHIGDMYECTGEYTVAVFTCDDCGISARWVTPTPEGRNRCDAEHKETCNATIMRLIQAPEDEDRPHSTLGGLKA